MGGPYMPPGFGHPSVNFPGPNATTNWGGAAYHPGLGYLIVNSQDLGQLTQIGPRGLPRELTIGIAGAGSGGAPRIPYDMVGVNGRFKHPELNMMCQQPPWGSLTAVNVHTGEFAWRVPLGVTDRLPPEKQKTGRPSSGGPIVTASGLVFIGATDDSRFRAFDAKTGQELWTEKLPASSHSVPVTYMGRNGKQYVVFPATGGSLLQDPAMSDSLLAYALP
jgi:quinoprotein glucose dehydrogenase